MPITSLNDPEIIQQVYTMKDKGMLISDIAKTLSNETGNKISQLSICRALNAREEVKKKELFDSDYPSLEDYSYLFNKKFQKDKNSTTIRHDRITIRRDLMLRILTNFYTTDFTYNEVKKECNDRDGDSNFLAHWDYLLKFNYIEKVDEYRFKFCDRVKQWKTFGKV